MNFQNGSPRATLGSLVPLAMFYTNSMRTTEDSSILKLRFLSLVLTYNFCNIELDALKSKQINAFHFSFPESNCNSRKGESCHSFRIYSIQE